ncbi:hypothetical protein VNO77_04623 [Canavalia gladiata]|uniref:Uncharacterized protein n=1 Tax=Canavalia gladiata TaxID=3824 RepID=A0AAN9R7Y2_CANGL
MLSTNQKNYLKKVHICGPCLPFGTNCSQSTWEHYLYYLFRPRLIKSKETLNAAKIFFEPLYAIQDYLPVTVVANQYERKETLSCAKAFIHSFIHSFHSYGSGDRRSRGLSLQTCMASSLFANFYVSTYIAIYPHHIIFFIRRVHLSFQFSSQVCWFERLKLPA